MNLYTNFTGLKHLIMIILNLGLTTRLSDCLFKKMRSCRIVNFAVSADHSVKLKERERELSTNTLLEKWKKQLEHETDGVTNCNWRTRYYPQRIGTGTGGLGDKRMGGEYPNDSIVEIGQNTKKSPGDLRKLAVLQTPVKNHQIMLGWKILKWAK